MHPQKQQDLFHQNEGLILFLQGLSKMERLTLLPPWAWKKLKDLLLDISEEEGRDKVVRIKTEVNYWKKRM